MQYALNNPLSYSKNILHNTYRMFKIPVGKVLLADKSEILAGAYQCFFTLLVLLFFAGIYFSIRQGFVNSLPALIFYIYYFLMHFLMVATPRYRLPFEPFLIIFACFALVSLKDKVWSKNEM